MVWRSRGLDADGLGDTRTAAVRDDSDLTLVTLGLLTLAKHGDWADSFCPGSEQAGMEGAKLRTRYRRLRAAR